MYSLIGHTSQIRALVVINEDYLASGAYDRRINIWSLTSNYTQVKSWQASTNPFFILAFDSTLNVLAGGEYTPTNYVKVWDSNLWNTGKSYCLYS